MGGVVVRRQGDISSVDVPLRCVKFCEGWRWDGGAFLETHLRLNLEEIFVGHCFEWHLARS